MRRHRSVFLNALWFVFLTSTLAVSARCNADDGQQRSVSSGLSHVRVVRLSFLEGTVTVRRPGESDWNSAMVNAPIEEGFSISTDKQSFAEVQFENGSAIWLGELSTLDFPQLELTPQGGHVNQVTLDGGYATLHIAPQRHDDYLLSAGGVLLTPEGKTEFRADVNRSQMRVEVFNGRVRAAGSNQTETLAKNHSLVRDDAAAAATFQVADKIEKDDWDKWTAAREQQSTLAYNDAAVSPASAMYGWDDLDVYGAWGYFPGYGNGWAPYEPLGWSPYTSGLWDWYPGMGLTWISGEPWGWLPFHYGFWNYDAGMGWFWMPGTFGAWNPALVNWYTGPGWVGWAPVGPAGPGGRAPCTLATAGCLTAVPPTTLRNGEPISPGSGHLVRPGSNEIITAISRPDFVPARNSPSASRPAGPSIPRNGNMAPNFSLAASGFKRGHESAPSSILMGRQVGVETMSGHRSAFGSSDPVHVRLGGTLGGKFPSAASSAFGGHSMTGGRNSNGSSMASTAGPRPQILSRGSGGGASPGAGGFGTRSGGSSSGSGRGVGMSPGVSSGGAGGGSRGGGGSHGGSSSGGGGHH